MYPDVFLKYVKAHVSYGDVEVLPTPEFFFGLEKDKESGWNWRLARP